MDAKKVADCLQFRTPASWWGEKWREGLFVGNGKLGANVYGGAIDEEILLNHGDLFWQGRPSVVPDISTKLKDIRKLIDDGNFFEAQQVAPKALLTKNFRPQAEYPLPLCVLRVKMNNSEAVCDYSRQLNMATGEATVSYTCGNTRVERNLFASRDKNMVVYQITKVGSETLNFEIDYELIHRINSRTPDGVSIMPDVVETQYDKTFMRFAGRNESGTDYGAVAKLNVNGGIVKPTSEGITVIGANSALITVMMFIEGNRTKEWASLQSELIAIKDSYDKLLRAHANIHGKLYNAVSLSLSTTPDEYVEDLIAKTNSGNIPAKLFEKMYNFGRYLMISAYSEGGRLLSPCGLWNGSYKAYKSFISSYGVLQTVYLSALNSNMPYAVESLFNYYEKFIGDFKDNAIRIFGCNGIFVPAIISPNTGRVGSTSVTVLNFTASAAWLSLLFFKYYERTGNIKFLKRLLPFMKETANFYEDFFKKSADGSYIISPSCLPMAPEDEVKQKDRPVISKNSALDFQIARNFFRALIKASADGKMYQRDVDRWREIASNLPENQTNSEGYFKEFINCMVAMDYTGISNGTLFGAYFGNDINFLSRKETSELYILTADHKLNNAGKETSFNMAVLASVYARLEQTEKAETCLTNVIRGCAMNNLALTEKDWRGMGVCGSGVWIPTQLQSNIAVTNAIGQMLLFCEGNIIKIMPCEVAEWEDISVKNFLTSCGAEVSYNFTKKTETLYVEVKAMRDTCFDLYLPNVVKKLLKSNVAEKLDSDVYKCVKEIKLANGKTANFLLKTK